MVRQFGKLIFFFYLGLCLQLNIAVAEEGSEADQQTEAALPDTSMLREQSQPPGFVELDYGGNKFEAILTDDRSGHRYGGVLVLPDKGNGFLDSDVIKTLSQNLPSLGWTVMTVALAYPDETTIMLSEEQTIELDIIPPAEEGTTETVAPEVAEPSETQINNVSSNVDRIQTAMTYLKQQDLQNYILIAHGKSTSDAISMLKQDVQIANVFISIGTDIPLEELVQLPDEVLMLDILPSGEDLQNIQRRKAEMSKLNKRYLQRLIPALDKNFTGYQRPLLSTVQGWLYKEFVEEKE